MYRNIVTGFWNDSKIETVSSFGKLLMLYLLTAPQGNLAGCFEVSYRRIEVDTGLTIQQAKKAMEELRTLGMLDYRVETSEVLIRNWGKYNWSKSPKLGKSLAKQIEAVRDEEFKSELVNRYNEVFDIPYPYPIDMVSIPYRYHSVSVSVSTGKEELLEEEQPGSTSQVGTGSADEIIACLNAEAGTSYRPNTKKTVQLIRATLNEGFTVDDFKAIISKKASDWRDDQRMSRYLRPETLFGTKFEGYLQEAKAVSNDKYAKYR